MRRYELVFVVDPRLSDDEVVGLSEEYRQMIAAAGARVVKEESWGKRRLAYPIRKLGEGRYVLFGVEAAGVNPFPEVEQRMRQNEKVLRYLTVRTDRAAPRGAAAAPAEARGREGAHLAAEAGAEGEEGR